VIAFGAPKRLFWRLLPIGVATVIAGALSYLIAYDISVGAFRADSFGAYLTIGVPAALGISLIMLLPMALIWRLVFRAGSPSHGLRRRAVLASGVCALVGVAVCLITFVHLTGEGEDTLSVLLPASIPPVGVAVVLTGLAFRSVKAEEA